MTLATYVSRLMRGRAIREVSGATHSGVSRGALHQIMQGVTTKPSPDTLAALARFFAEGDDALARRYYATMMALCGYLDLLPDAWSDVDKQAMGEGDR